MNRKSRVFILTVIIMILLLFSARTDAGKDFIKHTKNLFIQEKVITQSIEGNNEDSTVVLQERKDADYVIYIDEERYKLEKGDNAYLITTKVPLEEKYP